MELELWQNVSLKLPIWTLVYSHLHHWQLGVVMVTTGKTNSSIKILLFLLFAFLFVTFSTCCVGGDRCWNIINKYLLDDRNTHTRIHTQCCVWRSRLREALVSSESRRVSGVSTAGSRLADTLTQQLSAVTAAVIESTCRHWPAGEEQQFTAHGWD